jgi:hypothetical protein
MWDWKRKVVWLLTGLLFGTIFLYPLAREEGTSRIDWVYFLQLEMLLGLVIVIMLYIYSRK